MEQKEKACSSIIAAGKPFLCFFIRRKESGHSSSATISSRMMSNASAE